MYEENDVVRRLNKKSDVQVYNKIVRVVTGSLEVGNGSWGRIEFLTNHLGYRLEMVEKLR